MAEDAAALLLGGAAPHAVTLAADQGVLEARLAYEAAGAAGLGLRGVLLRGRNEDGGVEPTAGRTAAPREIHSLDHFLQCRSSKRVNQASVANNPLTAGEITPLPESTFVHGATTSGLPRTKVALGSDFVHGATTSGLP